ncbi:MAG: ABC transporter permease [Anaerolineaceae bacterium]|nr:ABC transporter permease [Anaerolineaceae bacterium]
MPTNQLDQNPSPSSKSGTPSLTNGALFGNLMRPFLPEIVAVFLLVMAFVVGGLLSPFFLNGPFLLDSTTLFTEGAIISLGMTFVIISGNIDLSVASTMGLTACVMAVIHVQYNVPMEVAIPIALVLGTLLGAFNGWLIARLRLPALAVTLATMALYRGGASILLGDHSLSQFPTWFMGVDQFVVPGTSIPVELILFFILALILGLVLHRTVFGRWVFALGTNEEAARYSGIPVSRVKIAVFALNGFLSALAGVIIVSRLAVARYDLGTGLELDVITAVVLGGTNIYGGRGTIFGSVIAVFLVGFLRTGLGVANVTAQNQLAVIGTLLIIAVIASNFFNRVSRQHG